MVVWGVCGKGGFDCRFVSEGRPGFPVLIRPQLVAHSRFGGHFGVLACSGPCCEAAESSSPPSLLAARANVTCSRLPISQVDHGAREQECEPQGPTRVGIHGTATVAETCLTIHVNREATLN